MLLAINALPRFNEANGNLGLQPWLQPSPSKPGRPLSKSQYPYKVFSQFGKERMPASGRIWPGWRGDGGQGGAGQGWHDVGTSGATWHERGEEWRVGGAPGSLAGGAEKSGRERRSGRTKRGADGSLCLGAGAGGYGKSLWQGMGPADKAIARGQARLSMTPSAHPALTREWSAKARPALHSRPWARKKARPREGAGRGADGSVREAPTSGGRARRGGGLR